MLSANGLASVRFIDKLGERERDALLNQDNHNNVFVVFFFFSSTGQIVVRVF